MAVQNQSWLELLDTSNSCSSDFLSPKRQSIGNTTVEENDDNTQEVARSKRNLEIEIFDAKNEKKFDEMVSKNKIKSPFKRRLSNEKLPEVLSKVDTPSRQRGKRSKLDAEENDYVNKKRVKDEEAEVDGDDELEEGEVLDKSIINMKKRFRSESNSDASSNGSSAGNFASREIETDKATLERRQKQIDYGKNTAGYDNYIMKVPKSERTRDPWHPKTPPKHLKYSRRAWEGLIKSWRKKLHFYDPQENVQIGEDDNATGF